MKQIRPKVKIDYQLAFEKIKKEGVGKAYLDQIKEYFPIYAQQGKMALGGGCGGNDGENDNNPLKNIVHDPLSTRYRLTTPTVKDIMKKNNGDSDEYGSLKFSCPVCNGEHKRNPHALLEFCPDKKTESGEPIPIPKC